MFFPCRSLPVDENWPFAALLALSKRIFGGLVFGEGFQLMTGGVARRSCVGDCFVARAWVVSVRCTARRSSHAGPGGYIVHRSSATRLLGTGSPGSAGGSSAGVEVRVKSSLSRGVALLRTRAELFSCPRGLEMSSRQQNLASLHAHCPRHIQRLSVTLAEHTKVTAVAVRLQDQSAPPSKLEKHKR